MCDEADGACDVWRSRDVTARKPHKCMACRETIAPGHRYHRVDSLYDGQWSRWVHCARCWTMWSAIRDVADWDSYVDPYLNCGEAWDDPPEHVARLAFALPGDALEADHAD
jgi:hypothetical protein